MHLYLHLFNLKRQNTMKTKSFLSKQPDVCRSGCTVAVLLFSFSLGMQANAESLHFSPPHVTFC